MNNSLKTVGSISVVVGFLIISFSISVYYLYLLPKNLTDQLEFEKVKFAQNKEQEENINKTPETEKSMAKPPQLNQQKSEVTEQSEIYREECISMKNEAQKKYADFINTCTGQGGNSIDSCINSDAGKVFQLYFTPDYLSICIANKKKLLY